MAAKKTPSTEPPLRMFVRRGALRRFDRLKREAGDLPVAVEWDRRLGDRRNDSHAVSADGRASERRKEPPFTWQLADFVVAEPATEKPRRSRTPSSSEATGKPAATRRR